MFIGRTAELAVLQAAAGSDLDRAGSRHAQDRARTAFFGIASRMPCLTFAYIDYRIRFPLSLSISPVPRPEGGLAKQWRLNLIQAGFAL